MKRLLSKTFVVAVTAVLVSAFGTTPAGASAAGGALLTGTISPDPIATAAALPPLTPFAVSTSQQGTAAGVIGTDAATCTVDLTTSGTTNIVQGSGSGSFSCSGAFLTGGTFTVSCSVTYVQTGGVIQVSGGCTGPAGTALSATCGIEVATTTIVTECAFTVS